MKYDIFIIGGGLLGLATALKISQKNPRLKVAVLEKEMSIGMHQSGNNSGVIHSGIYYKPGSLKAANCVQGRQVLLDFCRENKIQYEICGKIIVAASQAEVEGLNRLFDRGIANRLEGIKKLRPEEIKEYEVYAAGVAGIFVPQTGIVDFSQVVRAYAQLFQNHGGSLFLNSRATGIKRKSDFSEIQTPEQAFEASLVINCAGLYSDKIALFNRPSLHIRIVPFRGEYYKLRQDRGYLIKNMVYPVPAPAFPFLGAHFTRRINGVVEAGPNAVFAFKREGYKSSQFNFREFLESIFWPGFARFALKHWQVGAGEFYRSLFKSAFVDRLKKLIPDIQESDIEPAGAGVRAQAMGRDGQLIDDFLILEDAFQIDVINAPSPAATASLAIGQTIAQKALSRMR